MRIPAIAATALMVLPFSLTSVTAETVSPESLPPELVTPGAIMQVVLGLLLVIGAILAVAWLLRRVGGVVPNNGKMKIVAGMALGQRERVMLIQIGDSRQVLLGVTAQQINRLAEFDEPVVPFEEGGEFASRLRGVLAEKSKK